MRLPGKKFWAKAIRRRVSDEADGDDDAEPDILPWEVPFDQVNKGSSILEDQRTETASDASLHTSPGATRLGSTPSRALSPQSQDGKRLVRRRLVYGPVFGVKLDAVVDSTHLIELYEDADDLPDELYHWRYCPSVVVRCLQYLNREDRIEEEGLYRVPGSNQTVQELKHDFDEHGDVHIAARRRVQTADVASLLKLYLRELPTPIVSDMQAADLLARYDLDEKQLSLAMNSAAAKPRPHKNLRIGLSMLKLEQFFLLRALSKHLHAVQARSSTNLMDIHNLSIVFTSTSNLNLAAPLVSALIAKSDIWTDLTCCHLPGPVNPPKSLRSSTTSSPTSGMPVTAQSSSDSGQSPRPRKASLVSEVLNRFRHSDASNAPVNTASNQTGVKAVAEQSEDLWGGVANDGRPNSKHVSAVDILRGEVPDDKNEPARVATSTPAPALAAGRSSARPSSGDPESVRARSADGPLASVSNTPAKERRVSTARATSEGSDSAARPPTAPGPTTTATTSAIVTTTTPS